MPTSPRGRVPGRPGPCMPRPVHRIPVLSLPSDRDEDRSRAGERLRTESGDHFRERTERKRCRCLLLRLPLVGGSIADRWQDLVPDSSLQAGRQTSTLDGTAHRPWWLQPICPLCRGPACPGRVAAPLISRAESRRAPVQARSAQNRVLPLHPWQRNPHGARSPGHGIRLDRH